ncbi:MAG: exopolysaccharide Pel transporter PelG [Gammaproteobacteria bacterium]
MAGIGFEIRKFLKQDSFLGLFKAYGYAGLISSGPWVLSILGVLVIGIVSASLVGRSEEVVQFLVSVTYLMAASLIASSWLQLMFTRFVADRSFEKKDNIVLPNLFGALLIMSLMATAIGAALLPLFAETSYGYRLLMLANFVVLCNLWIVVIMVSGMRVHKQVLGVFALGYGVTVIAALALARFGLEGLMTGFLIGHVVLSFFLLGMVVREYEAANLVSFSHLRPGQVFYGLAFTGLFYNLATWADKLIFWYNPDTSEALIGPLRASIIYDPPIFLAYLSIIPGMAVFLLRMETDFVEAYDRFYGAIREGETFECIERNKLRMVESIRSGLTEILKVQGVVALLLIVSADSILDWVGISTTYAPLFAVDVAGVGVQVFMLGIFNVFFYLDKRRIVLVLSGLFLLSNAGFSYISQLLGPEFYGYGFACAAALTCLVGLVILSKKLERLEYETFMLQV